MFIRKKKNKSGSTSVVILDKSSGKSKVIKTIGSTKKPERVESLVLRAQQYIQDKQGQPKLFNSSNDRLIEEYLITLSNSQIRTIGPELVFGSLYNLIGYDKIQENMFRHLVVSRLAFPGSKLKTIDYMQRFQGTYLEISSVYRFLDKLSDNLKSQAEAISFNHTLQRLDGNVGVVFYDMTTIYFEASDEDDLRKTGFSKDGKHKHPQIFLGLLVGLDGWAIGYEIYEGNIYEGHTLIPTIQRFEEKYNLNKPIVIADSGLLSKTNIKILEEHSYQYIIGARLKAETAGVKQQIISNKLDDGQFAVIDKENQQRLIVSYSDKRSRKDLYNRHRGLKRLEKQIKAGRLTKSNVNNRGYNKYLKMDGEIKISIDYDKYDEDSKWDGLKGYVTNSNLDPTTIIQNYRCLWQIERAFRISKTDLRIRPIYHRLRSRIEAHICISFAAYSIIKELERALKQAGSKMSFRRAAYLTHNIYELVAQLPESKITQNFVLKMDEEQQELIDIIQNYCRVPH